MWLCMSPCRDENVVSLRRVFCFSWVVLLVGGCVDAVVSVEVCVRYWLVDVVCVVCMWAFVCVGVVVAHEACLAQSVERKTLNLVVVGSSPTVGNLFARQHTTPPSRFLGYTARSH